MENMAVSRPGREPRLGDIGGVDPARVPGPPREHLDEGRGRAPVPVELGDDPFPEGAGGASPCNSHRTGPNRYSAKSQRYNTTVTARSGSCVGSGIGKIWMRRLIDIKTGAELKVGDKVVSFGGTPMKLTHIDPMRNRVRAIGADEFTDFEFFPGIF